MNGNANVSEFEDWALSMGCPIENLPPKKSLNRVFLSSQSLSFAKMMDRVIPQQEVKRARDRIMVHSISNVDGKVLSKVSKQKLPDELRRWLKINKLNDRIKETKSRLAETKSEYQRFAKMVKENNINNIQSQQILECRMAKVAIVQAKTAEIEQKIEKEQSVAMNLLKVMPTKIEQNNASDVTASAAISNAVAELQNYYSADFDSTSYDVNEDARDKLWEKLRQIFIKIPNYTLWDCLFKQKGDQLMVIDAMCKLNVSNLLAMNNADHKNVKVAITKMYAKHIGLDIEKRKLGGEKKRLLDDYVDYYESFVTNLRMKFEIFNNNEIDDDFLDEYMQQLSTSCYTQAQIEFLQRSIGLIESEISQRKQMQQDHELLAESLRSIYNEIETLYCQMRDDTTALHSVRDKLEHNESMLRYLVQSKNEQQTLAVAGTGSTRQNLNGSMGSSFNSSNDSVLCSTKLESFDNTLMSLRCDPVRQTSVIIMPQHLAEMKEFLKIPIKKFRSQLSVPNQMEIEGNPLVCASVVAAIPKEMVQFIPYHLQTPNSILKRIQLECDWLVHQQEQLELVIHEKIPPVDAEKLNQLKNLQLDQLTEATDKINAICQKTAQVLDNVGRLFTFLVDNPLQKHIPKHKLFNSRTYYDYEREFMMYYNMIESKEQPVNMR